jgi:protein-S-isoprenylcysteine O-methyltransferase Ste14
MRHFLLVLHGERSWILGIFARVTVIPVMGAIRKPPFRTARREAKMSLQSGAIPLAVAALDATLLVRALITGCASASGDDIRRDENPFFYWTIILAAVLILILLLWKAYSSA